MSRASNSLSPSSPRRSSRPCLHSTQRMFSTPASGSPGLQPWTCSPCSWFARQTLQHVHCRGATHASAQAMGPWSQRWPASEYSCRHAAAAVQSTRSARRAGQSSSASQNHAGLLAFDEAVQSTRMAAAARWALPLEMPLIIAHNRSSVRA